MNTFESGGKTIRMESFFPQRRNDAPSILVLHGATGVAFGNRFIASLAQGFAGLGFAAHLLHYFDRTGTQHAADDMMRGAASAWCETVHDALRYIRKERPGAPIGLFGYSLGGYLAAAVSVTDPLVSATVVLAGGVDVETVPVICRAPPTLILHGGQDTRVPVSEANKLAAALRNEGGQPEMHLYPEEGHIMSMFGYSDVVRRVAVFFRKHLKPAA